MIDPEKQTTEKLRHLLNSLAHVSPKMIWMYGIERVSLHLRRTLFPYTPLLYVAVCCHLLMMPSGG